MRILISAGPTVEPIDGVRFISNRSSGKMGVALAKAALARGHEVCVVHGPLKAVLPRAAARIAVESCREMLAALERRLKTCDALIMAAAVCDVRPRRPRRGKSEKRSLLRLECVPNPDIVKTLASKKTRQFVVAFSLSATADRRKAVEKQKAKSADLMVYDDLASMEGESGVFGVLGPGGEEMLPCRRMTKRRFAGILMRLIEKKAGTCLGGKSFARGG